MKKLIVILASFLFILGLSTVSMALQNGSFEDGPGEIGAFITLTAGSTAITGWTVVSGSIDLIGSYWDASDGDRSIDLNGSEPGAISQVFDTEPGALYQIFFDMAGNPDGVQSLKVLVVSADSTASEYEFNSTGKTNTEMGWTEISFIFQASSDSTTLEFASISPDSAFGPALDNVRVIPIRLFPEDDMHPAGAVHAHDNLLWPPNNKKVQVEIEGYVIDELSMVRDGDVIGVSEAYLLVNGKKIILRNDKINKLNLDGSFSIVQYLKARKNANYPIELWAADTAAGEDGPNFGLVDSTFVRVPHDMSGKSKDKDSKKKKKSKKKKSKKKK
jgi:choice-of-anchor C domain-containing protein